MERLIQRFKDRGKNSRNYLRRLKWLARQPESYWKEREANSAKVLNSPEFHAKLSRQINEAMRPIRANRARSLREAQRNPRMVNTQG